MGSFFGPSGKANVENKRAAPPCHWVGLNALFGLGALPIVGEGQEIAWQAHIGGFVAGLLLFNAFDPAMPRSEFDAGLTDSRWRQNPGGLHHGAAGQSRTDHGQCAR
jgi:membrane associated rhomboid family serine protease